MTLPPAHEYLSWTHNSAVMLSSSAESAVLAQKFFFFLKNPLAYSLRRTQHFSANRLGSGGLFYSEEEEEEEMIAGSPRRRTENINKEEKRGSQIRACETVAAAAAGVCRR